MTEALAHRIIVPRRGGPEVLQWVPMDMPEPGPGDVRVRVEAAGVSAYDAMLRGHWFPGLPSLPYTPGEDFVGIVDKLGADVTGLHVGQRVGGWTFGDAGGYAEHLCRPAADLVAVPDGLDPATACALIVNYLTASLALHQASKVSEGEHLLVQGAGGGLGSALLQLGREAGLKTYGCDGTSKQAQIRADGAQPIDYQSQDVVARTRALTDGGADVAIDLVGGARQLLRSWRALRPDGRLLMLGMAGTLRSGTWIILPSLILLGLLPVWPGGRRIAKGPGMEDHPREHPRWYQDTLSGFFDMASAGRLTPHVAHKLSLQDAAKAHAMLERGQVSGKIILMTGDGATG
ncbi:zinc-binding dehydrogenase [Gelidibacter sp. F2691]|nr:zinc-binding dehydrogenase [Gelidibacter sp. F2691]